MGYLVRWRGNRKKIYFFWLRPAVNYSQHRRPAASSQLRRPAACPRDPEGILKPKYFLKKINPIFQKITPLDVGSYG